MPSCSHLNSESSIPEDLGSLAAESVPSEPMSHEQPESPDQSIINEEMAYSEDFKSSASPGKLVSELFCPYVLLHTIKEVQAIPVVKAEITLLTKSVFSVCDIISHYCE